MRHAQRGRVCQAPACTIRRTRRVPSTLCDRRDVRVQTLSVRGGAVLRLNGRASSWCTRRMREVGLVPKDGWSRPRRLVAEGRTASCGVASTRIWKRSWG